MRISPLLVVAISAVTLSLGTVAQAASVPVNSDATWTVAHLAYPTAYPHATPSLADFGAGASVLDYTVSQPNAAWTPASGADFTPNSDWIGSNYSGAGGTNTSTSAVANETGFYLFEGTYSLVGSPVEFAAKFASDNQVRKIYVNGFDISFAQTGTPEHTYETTSGHVITPNGSGNGTGTITIDFIVENLDYNPNTGGTWNQPFNPVGLIVNGSLAVVPLPSSLLGGGALLAAGAAFKVLRRRRA